MDIEGRLDQVDWALLAELQENARVSYTELGRRVGLTPPAVIERIRRLEDTEVITGYRVELNMERIGRPLRAVIRIAQNDKNGCNLGDVLRGMPEVLECDRVTGEDCYTMKVAVATPSKLEEFLDRLVVYGRTTTCMILSSPITHRIVESLEAKGVMMQDERALA